MGKMGLAGTSLVAAIPGGVLAYLMLMAVLNHLDPMPTILKVSAISLLVVAGAITLFPLFILIYGPKSPESTAKAKAKPDEKSSAAAAPAEQESFESADEPAFEEESFEEAESFDDAEMADDDAFEADGFTETEDEVDAGDYDEAFEFDEFENDDEK